MMMMICPTPPWETQAETHIFGIAANKEEKKGG